jgi:hypothetical protein
MPIGSTTVAAIADPLNRRNMPDCFRLWKRDFVSRVSPVCEIAWFAMITLLLMNASAIPEVLCTSSGNC